MLRKNPLGVLLAMIWSREPGAPPVERLAAMQLRGRTADCISYIASLCAIVVGSLVLAGWLKGFEWLPRIAPGLGEMNPMTACGLVLSGLAIGCHQSCRPQAGAALGVVIVVIGAGKLAEVAVGAAPLDEMLFGQLLERSPGVAPNRVAPNTAVAFLLLGISLLLVGQARPWAHGAAQVLALAVSLISLFAVVGVAFGIDQFSTVGPFIPMALHTGLCLLLLSLGTAALSRDTPLMQVFADDGPAGTLARRVLPLAVLIPIAAGAARLWGEHVGYYGTEAGVALTAVFNVLVTSALLVPSIFALYRSDCIRKAGEKALKQSEHFSRTINEASPDCLSLLDVNGDVLFANDAAVRAYGLDSLEELVGRPWGHRLDEQSRREALVALDAARHGGVGRLSLSLDDGRGGLRWFESLVSKLPDGDGHLVRFLVMSRDITQQRRVEEQMRWTATHDALTELPNRALFQIRLQQMGEAHQHGRFALLLLDIDDFKQVNDTLGHDAGDALLCTVAERLRRSLRAEDFVARLGGDEFAIILYGVGSSAGVAAAAEKILDALREPWMYSGRLSECRVSIGASIRVQPGDDLSELLKNADMALYAAKVQEHGRIAVFRPAMREAMQKRTSELSLARHALREKLIVPVYQPKVELGSGKLIGFEALLRWNHPGRGFQLPETLTAAFHDYELACELTDRILTGVLGDIRRWLDRGLEFGHVAVNVAAADFRQGDFAERLLARLDAANVPTERIQVEVTETVFLGRGAEYVERALKTLSDGGIRIALDDFGTGYASLSHLKQFPVDVVKIDRSFLRDISDAHNAAIIRTVVSLGRGLQLEVVAEGVETPQQEAFLIGQGCRLGQGFLFGQAGPAKQVPELIRSWPQRLRSAA